MYRNVLVSTVLTYVMRSMTYVCKLSFIVRLLPHRISVGDHTSADPQDQRIGDRH